MSWDSPETGEWFDEEQIETEWKREIKLCHFSLCLILISARLDSLKEFCLMIPVEGNNLYISRINHSSGLFSCCRIPLANGTRVNIIPSWGNMIQRGIQSVRVVFAGFCFSGVKLISLQ